MKRFEEPVLFVHEIKVEDVIATSFVDCPDKTPDDRD